MTEYNNDPLNLNEEEVLEIHEEPASLPEYDIFDLGDVDELFEDRKAAEEKAEAVNAENKSETEEIATVVYEDERYEQNNVTSVLPPYRRETTERSTEEITELSRKRNHESYEKVINDTPLVDSELYEAPE